MKVVNLAGVIALAATSMVGAEVAVEQWGRGELHTHRGALTIRRCGATPQANDGPAPASRPPYLIQIDVGALRADTRIRHASLHAYRNPIDGVEDQALIDAAIYPLEAAYSQAEPPKLGRSALTLEAPWFRSFDATGVVRQWVKDPATNHGLFVKAFPGWRPERTYLEITYEGRTKSPPPQVEGLRVTHRSGQTFITWREVGPRVEKERVTWGELQALLAGMDRTRRVRHRVYRHHEPIDARSIARAELLAEVAPFSGYNVRGRSVDQLISQTRRRAMDDQDLAKRLARGNYFSRYGPDMAEMADVPIKRFAIEDGAPLAPATGLYVHHPARAGKAYYAVVASVNGTANCRDFSPANSLASPVAEESGPGEPVFQGEASVSVLFDYPGRRLHYVQWAAPPLAHLPNQYFNWGVFVPRDYERATVRRLSIFFHDARQRYLKPPWPHRRDTVLLSPHDAPFRSYGYGHHEALGTLRSFGQGVVRPFLARRVDAVLGWALATYRPDAGRVSCGGSGFWGGTAALQYGLRRPGRIAYVMADGSAAPDPARTPYTYAHYPWRQDRPSTTRRPDMDAVWGKAEWAVKAEDGTPIWEALSLPAYVRQSTAALPYLSLGAGSMHVTWPQETDLLKAYMATRNAFMSEFFWGASGHRPLPVTAETGDHPFEPRADRPVLACRPLVASPNPKFHETYFLTGKRGYGGGSRLNTRPRWDPEAIVDRADRLEMTIFRALKVSYTGAVTAETTVRSARRFKPRPGETVIWSVTDLKTGTKRQGGEITVGRTGLAVIPDLTFAAPARLVLQRAPKPERSRTP